MILSVGSTFTDASLSCPSHQRPTLRTEQQRQWALERIANLENQRIVNSPRKTSTPTVFGTFVRPTSPKKTTPSLPHQKPLATTIPTGDSLRISQQEAMLQAIKEINGQFPPKQSEFEPTVSPSYQTRQRKKGLMQLAHNNPGLKIEIDGDNFKQKSPVKVTFSPVLATAISRSA